MKNNSGRQQNNIWWGPPRKFSTTIGERKISWLELFYDLVYVIVISRATHHLAAHPQIGGLVDYFLLFVIIFWGWVNGSMYHDLHGTQGIRTRFMTLWQMMAVAALAVTLTTSHHVFIFSTTVTLIFLQIFITYLWWSVGIYDKAHRRLNKPYTACYLAALIFIIASLYVVEPFKKILIGIALVLNYLPSFITSVYLKRRSLSLALSSNMVERLGLFTIIVFGEVILGVINGTAQIQDLTVEVWACFGMGILIVFALWWIFFAIVADRQIQTKFLQGQLISTLYIPVLASLGVAGAIFSGLIDSLEIGANTEHALLIKRLFGLSLSVFLISIWAISRHLLFPEEYDGSKEILRPLIFFGAIAICIVTLLFEQISLFFYLASVFSILLVIIITITRMWFKVELSILREKEG